jgi:His-Xaa-Ser system protein HxsD
VSRDSIRTVEDSGSVDVWVDLKLFELESVQRAALKLSRDACVEFETAEDGVRCRLVRRSDCTASLLELEHDFRCNMLDEQLRSRIAERTESIRNLILAHAFSRSVLVSPE